MLLCLMLPGARASQPPTPVFTVPGSVARGYQGQGFYVQYTINNTSHNQLMLANLTITLDYGTFHEVTSWNSGGQGVSTSAPVPIPMFEPVGNHTFTAAATLVYLDNNTDKWIPFSNNPQTVTGTLIVLPSPVTSALNNTVLPILLPIAGLIALPGVVLGTMSIRRARNIPSKGDATISSLPRSRFALFTLASTTTILASLLVVDSLIPFGLPDEPLLIDANIIGFVLLFGFLGTIFKRGKYSLSRFLPLVLLSVSATVVSSIRVQIVQQAGPCSRGIVGAGYPLPWAPIFFPSVSYPPYPVFLCPMILIQPLAVLASIGFLLDTAFYFGVGLCAIELYNVIKRWQLCKVVSLLDNR